MIEIVNLEECVDYVVKVVRRDDSTLYAKIGITHSSDGRHFVLDLGHGGGVCYDKCGRARGRTVDGLDIIWIKKIAKETEND